MSEPAVLKFGGTSVKNLGRIQHVAQIIEERRRRQKVVVVVSAMGDSTDYLLRLARQCCTQPDKRELDLLLATGEQISIALVSMVLRSLGVVARSFTAPQVGIFTENVHNKARIVNINSEMIARALAEHEVIVVAGFQGVTESGDITTLGRGGSDTTAVALAAATGAGFCDIYTDVDGVYSADPNLIASARQLSRISYGELLEMARLGAQVVHPRAVELAWRHGIKLRVRNTFKPDHEGTIIDGGENMEIQRAVSGVVMDRAQACVAIMDVPDRPGIAARITRVLADRNIGVDMIMQSFHPTTGVNNITFTVGDADVEETITSLRDLVSELGARDVVADTDIAKVSLIGLGLVGQPAVPARLFGALGDAGINIKIISSSEMKITCVVARGQAENALRVIHQAFELEAP